MCRPEMSCNGCRVLRKGCSDTCILRQSLQAIQTPQAQANATLFVAKFFGRAGLMSFLSAVPHSQRPALFQSLLFEACGRTINPVNGAVGLLWTGNWHACQSAVDTVLRGGAIRPLPEFSRFNPELEPDETSGNNHIDFLTSQDPISRLNAIDKVTETPRNDLDHGQRSELLARMSGDGRVKNRKVEKQRPATPSRNSDQSATTTLKSGSAISNQGLEGGNETKLLRLFF